MNRAANRSGAKQTVEVLSSFMAYQEVGDGDPILFLHGNPMTSFLWRNTVPHVQDIGRCIVPDLIGIGDSGRLASSDYRYGTHRAYLDAFCEALDIRDRVVLIGRDWGGALGFDWAQSNSTAVRGVAYGETVVNPTVGDQRHERAEPVGFCRPDEGANAILFGDFLLDIFLKESTLTAIPADVEEEYREYRRRWSEVRESRRPMLSWVQEVPTLGSPADVYELIDRYSGWMASTSVPKLLIASTEGQLAARHLELCRKWPNQTEVTVQATHFFQEDAPDVVGRALRSWILGLD